MTNALPKLLESKNVVTFLSFFYSTIAPTFFRAGLGCSQIVSQRQESENAKHGQYLTNEDRALLSTSEACKSPGRLQQQRVEYVYIIYLSIYLSIYPSKYLCI